MFKLLKFYADWCGPCKTFGPLVKEAADNANVTLENVDIEKTDSKALVDKYKVAALPTVILLNDDVEVARHVGLIPRGKINDWMKEHTGKKVKK